MLLSYPAIRLKFFSALALSISAATTLNASSVLSQSDSGMVMDRNSTKLLPLAKVYLAKEKPEAAKNLLETMLQLYPQDGETHLLLGEAYVLEKDYLNARSELSWCLRMGNRLELAAEANKQLLRLPKRFLRPRKLDSPACQASSEKESLLVFFANWDAHSVKLKDMAETTAGQSTKLIVKTFDLEDPSSTAVFNLYNVSAIPTVVVLSKGKQHIIASLSGTICTQRLRNLIVSHSNLSE